MTTTLLSTPRRDFEWSRHRPVPALPGRRDGALMPAGLDLRPCVTHDPQWWDTGNENNADAIAHCRTCPWQEQCAPANGRDAAGTIRNGIPYDDYGRPAPTCTTCGGPIVDSRTNPACINGHGGLVADHHHTIGRMLNQGATWQQIADRIGFNPHSVSRYWRQHLNISGQRAIRTTRLPGVPEGCTTNRARDWHRQIIAMLCDPAAYSYDEVAYAIGSTRDSVKSHWLRYQHNRVKAGLPKLARPAVSNRPHDSTDRQQVPA